MEGMNYVEYTLTVSYCGRKGGLSKGYGKTNYFKERRIPGKKYMQRLIEKGM